MDPSYSHAIRKCCDYIELGLDRWILNRVIQKPQASAWGFLSFCSFCYSVKDLPLMPLSETLVQPLHHPQDMHCAALNIAFADRLLKMIFRLVDDSPASVFDEGDPGIDR